MREIITGKYLKPVVSNLKPGGERPRRRAYTTFPLIAEARSTVRTVLFLVGL